MDFLIKLQKSLLAHLICSKKDPSSKKRKTIAHPNTKFLLSFQMIGTITSTIQFTVGGIKLKLNQHGIFDFKTSNTFFPHTQTHIQQKNPPLLNPHLQAYKGLTF